MPLPVLPEPRKVLMEALRARPSLTTPIVLSLLENQTWPVIRLVDIDDVELRPEAIACRTQVEIWGAGSSLKDEDDVNAIASTVRSVSRDCDGAYASGRINNCRATNRLPASDPSGRVRVLVDMEYEITQ